MLEEQRKGDGGEVIGYSNATALEQQLVRRSCYNTAVQQYCSVLLYDCLGLPEIKTAFISFSAPTSTIPVQSADIH